MTGAVLVCNAGSSSLKAEVRALTMTGVPSPPVLARAQIECQAGDFAAAAGRALDALGGQAGGFDALCGSLRAVAHRIVHGGMQFRSTVRIDAAVLQAIEALAPLAPLHNPPALAVIRATSRRLPVAVPAFAVFDTAFHAGLPAPAARLPLPRAWTEAHAVRRFGFHGLAHRAMLETHARVSGCGAGARVISLQLGQGCSITASRGGAPVDTSMGFTPLGGLIMGTRPGDQDPGALLYLQRMLGLGAVEMERELSAHAGLLALSGVSGDMRELLRLAAGGHDGAQLAISAFCQRARLYLGGYIAILGGADAVLFGGGIGEHAPAVRTGICGALEALGIELDAAANASAVSVAGGEAACISTASSRVAVWVIGVDEAAVMVQEVLAALGGGA